MKATFNVDGDNFDFLIGKAIKEVKNNTLICEDGTKITIEENEGCGGCGNGWSSLEDLKILEGNGVITNVESKYETNSNDKFKLFIYYHEKALEISGDDGYGNGYYGGGFYVTIENIMKEKENE